MKKLLLSFLCVLGLATAASAETYTIRMDQDLFGTDTHDLTTPWTAQGFTFTADKAAGNNNPAYNKAEEVRLYANNTLTIAANGANITSISFTISAQGLKRFAELTPSVGEIAEQYVDPLVWNGSAPSVTFTVGADSHGTETGKPGQFDFASVTITTDGAVSEVETPVVPEVAQGVYTATTTIADGKYLLYASDIIATPLEASKSYGYLPVVAATVVDGTITTDKDNEFTITAVEGGYTIQGPDARYYYMKGTYNSFNLSAERIEGDVWTIQTTDEGTVIITNVAMEKSLQFDPNYNSYGAYPDVRGVYPTLYVYTKDAEGGVEPPVEPEVPAVENLTAFYDFANNDKFEMAAPLTVVYANGAYVYVYDGASYGLVYKYDLGLTAGDVIAAGWKGHVSIYNELVELVPDTEIAKDGTAEVPEPLVIDEVGMAAMTLMPYNQNLYIKLVNVAFDAATPDATNATFTGKMTEGEEEYTITFRNPFKLAAVEAGSYDVVAFVSLYKTTVQINPVEFLTATTAIENVAIENAPVRYFNLQGIEVANPHSGNIYIRVQGNTAVKVIK